MSTARYEITADEARTHESPPLNRYWCFFGGVFGLESDCDRLEHDLRAVVTAAGLGGEIKWSSVTGNNLIAYKTLVDMFFHHLEHYDLSYRQMFLDRSFVHVPLEGERPVSSLDLQFKIYYQFLKHSFGLQFLTARNPALEHHVTIRLDNHSSQAHKSKLTEFIEQLPIKFEASRLVTRIQFVNSKHFLRLQVCDLLMGAAGSHGNKMDKRREPGQRGMTKKQKWRLEMAKYIYNQFRKLDASERGSRAFNWFESTGHAGNAENRLNQKLRIWKFTPSRFRLDHGWKNDNLDSQGRYLVQQISTEIHMRGKSGSPYS